MAFYELIHIFKMCIANIHFFLGVQKLYKSIRKNRLCTFVSYANHWLHACIIAIRLNFNSIWISTHFWISNLVKISIPECDLIGFQLPLDSISYSI